MSEFKNKVEAILFSTGKRMNVEEIARLCRTSPENVTQQLRNLKKDYEAKESSLILEEDGPVWKLAVRTQYAPVVRKLVSEAELAKTVMETLAIIAWKAPVLQSDVIKVRTNKAYDHLKELEETGFITRERYGRTRLVKLTERFFNYFDVRSTQSLKEQFKVEDTPETEQPEGENPPELTDVPDPEDNDVSS